MDSGDIDILGSGNCLVRVAGATLKFGAPVGVVALLAFIES